MLRYLLIVLFLNLFSNSVYSVENSISAGSTIKARMAEPIDSRVRQAGYHFKVTIEGDINIDNKTVIKSGSKAQAIINKIQKSGKGKQAPEIVVSLTRLNLNNRQTAIHTFPIAGKGTKKKKKKVGEVDENENVVIGKQGKKITTSIPIITKGYDLILSEGTVLYFILKEPIAL